MDEFIFILELISTAAYAVLGAMKAVKKEMDMFGTVVMGVTTAIGGGVIRDIVIGKTPPTAFVSPIFTAVAAIFSGIVLITHIRKRISENSAAYDKILFILDTVGLGAFTVTGVGTVIDSGNYNMLLIVFVGVITGVGGGVMRDIFAGDIPYIFVKHIYALASIAGALVCALLWRVADKNIAVCVGMATVIIIRCFSAHYKWNVPVKKIDTMSEDR